MSDLISRQNALDALKEYEVVESDNFTKTDPISMMTVATIANCIEVIWELPSAEPERSKGKWIWEEKIPFERCRCSECGYCRQLKFPEPDYFCPNCGADMRRP